MSTELQTVSSSTLSLHAFCERIIFQDKNSILCVYIGQDQENDDGTVLI